MAVLSVSSVTTSFISYPLPTPPPLKLYVTLQTSQTVTDFARELAQPISFVCSDIIWVQDRFCTFTQMAFETSNFPHVSQLAR